MYIKQACNLKNQENTIQNRKKKSVIRAREQNDKNKRHNIL